MSEKVATTVGFCVVIGSTVAVCVDVPLLGAVLGADLGSKVIMFCVSADVIFDVGGKGERPGAVVGVFNRDSVGTIVLLWRLVGDDVGGSVFAEMKNGIALVCLTLGKEVDRELAVKPSVEVVAAVGASVETDSMVWVGFGCALARSVLGKYVG